MGKPAKATLVNTATAGVLRFHFNPTELRAQIQANYARVSSLGGVGQRLHYNYTNNFVINTDVYMDKHALVDRSPTRNEFFADELMRDTQVFLLSCLFPVGRQNDPIRRAPPRLLFLWPGIMELPVRMISQSFNFSKFENSLLPWIFSVPLVMESDLSTTRITSDVIASRGFQLAGYGS